MLPHHKEMIIVPHCQAYGAMEVPGWCIWLLSIYSATWHGVGLGWSSSGGQVKILCPCFVVLWSLPILVPGPGQLLLLE